MVAFIGGGRSFKFENMLSSRVLLIGLNSGGTYLFQGSPSFILTSKLKTLKVGMYKWVVINC